MAHFLGYTFGPERFRKDGHWCLGAKLSKKALARMRERVRHILHPGNQEPWPEVRDQLNRTLRGWANYFHHGTLLMAHRVVDNHVLDRVRYFLRRRTKVRGSARIRFSDHVVFGELGIVRLRALHLRKAP